MRYLKELKYEVSPQKDLEMLSRLLGNKKVKQAVVQRFMCLGVLLFIWVYVNGGLVPKFLHKQMILTSNSESSLLAFFPAVDDNAAMIKWAREVNSQEMLERALYSRDLHMIESDLMIRGQGTSNQELVAVMAQLPQTDGALTFTSWLEQVIKASAKGFKLDFQAFDAVEITLQELQDKKSQITVPVWLHADVLQGPLGNNPRIESTRFIKIVKKMFPESTLSLGWTTGFHTDVSQISYTWNMILDMYYVVHNAEVKPPLVFSVRASFLENSIPQLKWLLDNTGGSLYVWQHPSDHGVQYSNILRYLCYRFPPKSVFFDLSNDELETMVQTNRRITSNKDLDARVEMRDSLMFRPEAWVKMGFHMEAHSILGSTEAVVLQSRAVYMVTKSKYTPNPNVRLQGRVQFFNRRNLQEEHGRTGLSIFVRSSQYMHFEDIKGIKCFIGIDGEIVVESVNMPDLKIKESHKVTPGSADCYRFSVVDEGPRLMFVVTVLPECHTLESAKPIDRIPAEINVRLPAQTETAEHPFIVKLEDSRRTAVLDELTVKFLQ
ncbi:uncharacterized protein LOC127878018 [Dreissena polymorpha]|uniref:Protein FAM151A n=1 Tax=Dreissena polymorpha TaxID=45954 RepID=A0A9D4HE73_DREPO|nr:uncharacterized protein LOC127878018 [Dreissena polymorpha]KAH3831794.1 hypothetical protein DPMN_105064 [Dreissena polymorpha]